MVCLGKRWLAGTRLSSSTISPHEETVCAEDGVETAHVRAHDLLTEMHTVLLHSASLILTLRLPNRERSEKVSRLSVKLLYKNYSLDLCAERARFAKQEQFVLSFFAYRSTYSLESIIVPRYFVPSVLSTVWPFKASPTCPCSLPASPTACPCSLPASPTCPCSLPASPHLPVFTASQPPPVRVHCQPAPTVRVHCQPHLTNP